MTCFSNSKTGQERQFYKLCLFKVGKVRFRIFTNSRQQIGNKKKKNKALYNIYDTFITFLLASSFKFTC